MDQQERKDVIDSIMAEYTAKSRAERVSMVALELEGELMQSGADELDRLERERPPAKENKTGNIFTR